jgi:hypothetical protein
VGGFLQVGGPRRRVTLHYAPDGPLDTHKLTFAVSNHLAVYAAETEGVLLTDLAWDDADPPDGHNDWDQRHSEVWLQATGPSGGSQGDSASLNYAGRTAVNTGGHTDGLKVTAVRIVETASPMPDPNRKLWWFGGEDAASFAEEMTLTAEGASTGTFVWEVTEGAGRIDLNDGGDDADTITAEDDNTVVVKSTGGSAADDDVCIRLTIDGQFVCDHKLTVSWPYSLRPGALEDDPRHEPSEAYGYLSFVWYCTVDRLGSDLPHCDVEINEVWTTGLVQHYEGTDWRQGGPLGGVQDAAHWCDNIGGAGASQTPTPQVPQTPLGGTKVVHWGQAWRLGSTIPMRGQHVQTNVFQKYRDHAAHE